jgi:glyceraldehyde-3-phosphate dehydrogenase (NADP+)
MWKKSWRECSNCWLRRSMAASRFLVNGQWRSSSIQRPVRNPFNDQVVGEVYQASSRDIDEAIAGAVDAFSQTRKLSSHQRWSILAGISAEIDGQKEKLAQLVTAETGKAISAARLEVERAVFTFLTAAEEAKRIGGEVFPLDLAPNAGDRVGIVRRFPLGPVGGITPFNFPINLVAHKVGPAIAAGDPIVLKPSSSAPLIALALAEIVDGSELPKGGFNIVPCLANEADQLVTDQRLKLISFTGSPPVGWSIKERAGRKRVVLELGGNAGVIVDRDANLEYALPRIVWGSYGTAGQSCIAVQRIFVQESVFPGFLSQFVELSRRVATGDPLDPKTVVGPMITEHAARKVEAWIQEAVAGGAKVLCGGKREGAVLEPTVLVDVNPGMNVCAEEVFAPVVTVEPFGEFAAAVEMVNNSKFGLQAGVFSNSMDHIFYAYERLEVGGVIVNDVPTYRIDHMPYGGVKDSGFGREGLRYAIEEMTEMKLLGMNILA